MIRVTLSYDEPDEKEGERERKQITTQKEHRTNNGNRSNSHTPDPADDFDDDPADGSEDASDSRVDARDDASSAATTTLRRRRHRRRSLLQRHQLGAVRGEFLVDVGVVHVGADGRNPDADPHGAKGCVRLLRILSERSDGCGRAVGRLERGRGLIRFQTVFLELGVRSTGGWCGRTRLGELSREWG